MWSPDDVQCPKCEDDGLVVVAGSVREYLWLVGGRPDPKILADGIRASRSPLWEDWAYLVCAVCGGEGVWVLPRDRKQA